MVWLRLVHILAGILWVGAAVLLGAFILPTARSLGDDGGRFVARLMQRGLGPTLGIAMLLTIVSGLAMYGRLSAGFNRVWVTSPHGLVLGAGAVAALLSLLIGVTVNGPVTLRLAKLRQSVAARGAAPSPVEAAQLAALQSRRAFGSVVSAGLLLLAPPPPAAARAFLARPLAPDRPPASGA